MTNTTTTADTALRNLLTRVRDAIDDYLAATAAPAQDLPRIAAAEPANANGAESERIRRLVLDEVVARTGYPEEMLDLDLDVEADLGIDSVKQAVIYGAVREKLEVPADPDFRLREHNTLRKVIAYMTARVPA